MDPVQISREHLERAKQEQKRLNDEVTALGAREREIAGNITRLKGELIQAFTLESVQALLAKIATTEAEHVAVRQLQQNIAAGPLREANELVQSK